MRLNTCSTRIKNCTIKIPAITEKRLYSSNLMAMTKGMAMSKYLKIIDPKESANALPLVFTNFKGSVSPIIIKLRILNRVPRIKPLPTGFWPMRMKKNPAKIAAVIAWVQYFFWVCLTASIFGTCWIIISLFGDLDDLAVYNVGTADNAQNDKDG